MAEFFRVGRYFDTPDAERTRTEQLERQKQEQRYLGSTILRPGMRLYQFNYKTGECREIGTERRLEFDPRQRQQGYSFREGPIRPRLRISPGPQQP